MKHTQPLWRMEAAFKLSEFTKREFGLSPADACAELRDDILTIRLMQVLTPVGHVVAQSEQGAEALQSVYSILHEVHQKTMENLISRIAGAAVQQSQIKMDLAREDIVIWFRLNIPSQK